MGNCRLFQILFEWTTLYILIVLQHQLVIEEGSI